MLGGSGRPRHPCLHCVEATLGACRPEPRSGLYGRPEARRPVTGQAHPHAPARSGHRPKPHKVRGPAFPAKEPSDRACDALCKGEERGKGHGEKSASGERLAASGRLASLVGEGHLYSDAQASTRPSPTSSQAEAPALRKSTSPSRSACGRTSARAGACGAARPGPSEAPPQSCADGGRTCRPCMCSSDL